jgi:peptidyl-prolyl cis-trans isomerase D
MFDAVRNNKRIVQVFLGLITLPFAFWGVDSYMRNTGAGSDLASVGDSKITVPQFEQALRERQDQLRQSLGENYKPEMMNLPEVRLSILNSLVDQRILMLEAGKNRLLTSDAMLRDVIRQIPSLQEDGKFSMDRYESALRAQGMSQPQFEARMRQDLTIRQLIGAVGETAFVSTAQAEAMLRLQSEERQYSEFRVAPEQFADKVKIEAAAVQKYYDENKAQFEVPEQVKAEYLVLSLEAMLSQVTVSDDEVKTWYETHKKNYTQPEERRASHILVLANGETDKDKAKAKAEDVLKEVQKSPEKFADLAKKYSEDPGSAKAGGDLGFFGQGMMVKEFEDTVFKQKEGEISGLVKSDFGYHIIKLTGIKPSKERPLDDVRPEIEGELKRQAASRKFAEVAESFNNTVYEQSDSLQPAAEKFNLKIQKSDWLPKNPSPEAVAALGQLGNEKILSALFSEDAVKNKRNTEAVEVAPSTLVAARVLEHAPAAVKPFDEVKADVEKMLKAREMTALAKKTGESTLAELKQGGPAANKLAWSAVKTVSRIRGGEVPRAVIQTVFKADVQTLPAYAGSEIDGDYVVYKIVKVNPLEKVDEAQRKALQTEYGAIVAQEELAAYLTALRARYKININTSLLETRDRQ